jgi:hypothetical protein
MKSPTKKRPVSEEGTPNKNINIEVIDEAVDAKKIFKDHHSTQI